MSEAQSNLALLRLARDDGRLDDALFLVGATVSAADAERDYEAGANALASVARIYMSRAEFADAVYWQNERLEYAQKHRMRATVAGALHDLAIAYDDAGCRRDALTHYGRALEHYPNHSRRIPILVADMMRQELRQNNADKARFAASAWQACAVYSADARERLCAFCNLVQAASIGVATQFDKMWEAMLDVVEELNGGEGVARALLCASESALRARRHSEAHAIALRAYHVAQTRGERLVAERAESLSDSARRTV